MKGTIKLLKNSMSLGNKIKEIRINEGLTLEQFGNILGTSKSVVSKWERGVTKPNKARLKHIADLAGISATELLSKPLEQYSSKELLEELTRRATKKDDL